MLVNSTDSGSKQLKPELVFCNFEQTGQVLQQSLIFDVCAVSAHKWWSCAGKLLNNTELMHIKV